MQFRIADTFTDSLAKLTNDEQKAVKTTVFDLQLNPVNPGMSFDKDEQVDAFESLLVLSLPVEVVHPGIGHETDRPHDQPAGSRARSCAKPRLSSAMARARAAALAGLLVRCSVSMMLL